MFKNNKFEVSLVTKDVYRKKINYIVETDFSVLFFMAD